MAKPTPHMNGEGYEFNFQIQKGTAATTAEGKLIIEGIASSSNVDRQDESMSPAAIKMMLDQIKGGKVPLHNEHGRSWHDRIGDVVDGAIDGAGNLTIKAELNKKHPLTQLLYDSIKKGDTFGLSIAGKVKGFTQQMRTDLGKMVRVFDNIQLREISVTKHPANLSAIGLVAKNNWLHEIAKSIPEEEWLNQERKGDTMDPEETVDTPETSTETESTETVETPATEEAAPDVETAEETPAAEEEVTEKAMRKIPVSKRRALLAKADQAHAVYMQALKAAIGHEEPDDTDETKPGMVGAGQKQRDLRAKKSEDVFDDVELVAKALRRLITEDKPTGIDKVTKAMSEVIEESNAKRDQLVEALIEKSKAQDALIEELRSLPLRRKGVAVSKGAGDEVTIARKSDPEPETTPTEEAADFRSAYKNARIQ